MVAAHTKLTHSDVVIKPVDRFLCRETTSGKVCCVSRLPADDSLTFSEKSWVSAAKKSIADFPVEIRHEESSGNGLYAVRDVCSGEVVVAESPYAMVVCESAKKRTCSLCFYHLVPTEEDDVEELELPERCVCGEQWFCNPACRTHATAAGLHPECIELSREGE
jgi:hypothetical protein